MHGIQRKFSHLFGRKDSEKSSHSLLKEQSSNIQFSEAEFRAAILVQRHWRGYKARKWLEVVRKAKHKETLRKLFQVTKVHAQLKSMAESAQTEEERQKCLQLIAQHNASRQTLSSEITTIHKAGANRKERIRKQLNLPPEEPTAPDRGGGSKKSDVHVAGLQEDAAKSVEQDIKRDELLQPEEQANASPPSQPEASTNNHDDHIPPPSQQTDGTMLGCLEPAQPQTHAMDNDISSAEFPGFAKATPEFLDVPTAAEISPSQPNNQNENENEKNIFEKVEDSARCPSDNPLDSSSPKLGEHPSAEHELSDTPFLNKNENENANVVSQDTATAQQPQSQPKSEPTNESVSLPLEQTLSPSIQTERKAQQESEGEQKKAEGRVGNEKKKEVVKSAKKDGKSKPIPTPATKKVAADRTSSGQRPNKPKPGPESSAESEKVGANRKERTHILPPEPRVFKEREASTSPPPPQPEASTISHDDHIPPPSRQIDSTPAQPQTHATSNDTSSAETFCFETTPELLSSSQPKNQNENEKNVFEESDDICLFDNPLDRSSPTSPKLGERKLSETPFLNKNENANFVSEDTPAAQQPPKSDQMISTNESATLPMMEKGEGQRKKVEVQDRRKAVVTKGQKVAQQSAKKDGTPKTPSSSQPIPIPATVQPKKLSNYANKSQNPNKPKPRLEVWSDSVESENACGALQQSASTSPNPSTALSPKIQAPTVPLTSNSPQSQCSSPLSTPTNHFATSQLSCSPTPSSLSIFSNGESETKTQEPDSVCLLPPLMLADSPRRSVIAPRQISAEPNRHSSSLGHRNTQVQSPDSDIFATTKQSFAQKYKSNVSQSSSPFPSRNFEFIDPKRNSSRLPNLYGPNNSRPSSSNGRPRTRSASAQQRGASGAGTGVESPTFSLSKSLGGGDGQSESGVGAWAEGSGESSGTPTKLGQKKRSQKLDKNDVFVTMRPQDLWDMLKERRRASPTIHASSLLSSPHRSLSQHRQVLKSCAGSRGPGGALLYFEQT